MDDASVCIFLPGIIAPAVIRYGPLIAELGDSVDARTKELEVYSISPPPPGYSIDSEIEGLLLAIERLAADRVHLYGHSAGGAVALAFTAAHPQLVRSLALDEAAFDFSDEMLADIAEHFELLELLHADPAAAMPRFLAMDVKPGVDLSPPPGPPPLPNRPAGVAALLAAFRRHRLDSDALRSFAGPVLYTRGSLSAERYERSAARLGELFSDFRAEVFEGLHHLNTSHLAEPARVAALLRVLWAAA